MRQIDRRALLKCVKIYGATAEGRARIRAWEADATPWIEQAHTCCYSLQMDALALPPWAPPPCWAEDGAVPPHEDKRVEGKVAAWELRRRMHALGLSHYEPDPPRAIAEAEGKLAPLRPDPPAAA